MRKFSEPSGSLPFWVVFSWPAPMSTLLICHFEQSVFISCAGRHPIQFLTDSYDFQISCGSRSMGSGSPRPRGGNYPGNLGARLLYLNIKPIHPIFCSPKPWQLTIPRPTHAAPHLGEPILAWPINGAVGLSSNMQLY